MVKKSVDEGGGEGEAKQSYVLYALIAVLFLVVAFNQYQIMSLSGMVSAASALTYANYGSYGAAGSDSGGQEPEQGTAELQSVIPTGTPRLYGAELGISYDDISPTDPSLADQTIRKLANYDVGITLEGENLERYKGIGLSISCEYCCGADAIIFPNGQAACGCAHSYAMRGLAKYLITEHGDEFTDEQILEELGKWKVLFFPGIHEQKAQVLKEQGIEVNYINLASNKYRGIEQGASGGAMVGGC